MSKRFAADWIVPVADLILAPLVLVAAVLMKIVRRFGVWRMPVSKAIFNRVGIYPIRDHYYEPMYNYKKYLRHSLRDERSLPGNEQYLLEAFLSCNPQFEIILALNFLSHRYPAKLTEKFPMLRGHVEQAEPRSFWIRKVA